MIGNAHQKIIPVNKSIRIRWSGHVARMGESRGAYRVWHGNVRKRDHLESLGVDWRIILKCILKGNGGMGWVWLIIGKDGGRL
jgi:hypothetical protein